MTSRNLYLDLLIKILANTIYEDPAINPSRNRRVAEPYDATLRSVGRDWPTVAHTMVGIRRLENLRELAQRALDEGIRGDFIETGVWRGGCCILMRGVLAANNVADRRIYVADSFSGLPPPEPSTYPADAGLDLSTEEILAVPLEIVRKNFERYGLLDEQVVFVKGLFAETLPKLAAGPFALVRLDGDLYESTYIALDALYPRLSPGGFIIVDDLNCIPACRQAVADYRTRMAISAEMHQIDWAASWWRKEF